MLRSQMSKTKQTSANERSLLLTSMLLSYCPSYFLAWIAGPAVGSVAFAAGAAAASVLAAFEGRPAVSPLPSDHSFPSFQFLEDHRHFVSWSLM